MRLTSELSQRGFWVFEVKLKNVGSFIKNYLYRTTHFLSKLEKRRLRVSTT